MKKTIHPFCLIIRPQNGGRGRLFKISADRRGACSAEGANSKIYGNSRSASFHPGLRVGVQMGNSKFSAGFNPLMNYMCHPIQEGVETFLVTSCYRKRDKLWPYGATWLISRLNLLFCSMCLWLCQY